VTDPTGEGLVRGLVSWLLYGVLAITVAVVALVCPSEPIDGYGPYPAYPEPTVSAAREQPAVGKPPSEQDDPLATDTPTDEEALAALDPESLLDDAVAEEAPEGTARIVAEQAPDISLAEVEVVDHEEWILHRVVPLETADQIAHRYGVRPESLRLWNGLAPTATQLEASARLRVKPHKIPPARVVFEYIVQPGDTWWKIGTRYGVDSGDLRHFNWDAGQRLTVGQKIRMWIDPIVYQWVRYGSDGTRGEVRRGAVGVGPPQQGRLVNGVLLPDSPYYRLRLPPSSYGTTHAVSTLIEAIVRFRARSEYGKVLVFGSMSRKHGGPLAGHISHQTGRDLDVRLPLREKVPANFPVEPRNVDWAALWHFVTACEETHAVSVVFLEYALQEHLHDAAKRLGATDEERKRVLQWPRGTWAPALVRDSPGHDGHIHIRFTCGPHEPECVEKGDDDERDGG
jgi:LysM repeat protein